MAANLSVSGWAQRDADLPKMQREPLVRVSVKRGDNFLNQVLLINCNKGVIRKRVLLIEEFRPETV